uniref:Otogelin like n=1 Tax=Meleagris gallopavo TaxID=9103 RepID=A0A803XUQ3_MELGA
MSLPPSHFFHYCTSCKLSVFSAVPNNGKDRDGICKSWGQYHFETFDGIYYYFPGNCSYIFAKDCGTAEPHYTVWVHNSPHCHGSVYSCQRSISLFFSNQEEITISGHEVRKEGNRLMLPQTVGNVFFERLADYILVKTTFGFSLAWDGNSGIYIKLTEDHHGKPCGLCGNFNGDKYDDLILSTKLKIIMLVQKLTNCCLLIFLNAQDIFFKCQIFLQFPFLSCHESIDPYSYISSCMNDLCRVDDDETYCRAVTEYARACSHAGSPVRDWRDDFPACTEKCEDSFVHRDCISCCPPTCTFEKDCLGSNLYCLDGCYCPDGLIMENGTCISVSNCPCIYHGTAFPVGTKIEQECSNCVCTGGIWNCTDHDCPAECSVTGNSHFTTFDGRHFTFLGICQYILVKGTGKNKFTITLQKAPCGHNFDHACIESITLVLEDDVSKQVTLTRYGQVQTGPNQGAIEIQNISSLFVQLKTTFGLKILFAKDGERIYVQVDINWKTRTLGLCGTYNGNLRDDFLSPAGMIEGTPQLHANAWKVSSACSVPINVPVVDPCNVNQQNIGYASHCDIINEEVFAPCHAYISPGLYYQLCRFDACKCGSSCMCNSLAHYAYVCGKHGISVDFRSHISYCGEKNTLFFYEYVPFIDCEYMLYLYAADKTQHFSATVNKNFKGKPQNSSALQGLKKKKKILIAAFLYSVCRRGVFNCTSYPCPAVCTIYGDRHYYTFDGLEYDYASDCQAYLLKSTDNSNISVIAQNKKCFDNDIVCSKNIFIAVGDSEIYFSELSEKQSTLRGQENKSNYQLWMAGYYTVIHFPEQDITILWDKKTMMHVTVGPQWKGKLAGLCGNFDKYTSNDLTTSNNMEVRNAQVFGDTWVPNETLRPCEVHQNKFPYAKKECSILYSDVFAPCRNVIDVTSFVKNCHTDTCNCNLGGDCECLCTSIAAYAHKCCQHGAVIHWRSPSLCGMYLGWPHTTDHPEKGVYMAFLFTKIQHDTSRQIFPLPRNAAYGNVFFSFMITPGLFKDKDLSLSLVSLESAERPNYFLYVRADETVGLEQWQASASFQRRATFFHHQGLWSQGLSAFELHSKKGFFIILTSSGVKVAKYDDSEEFKHMSSFKLSASVPYRKMCEWRYESCASPCFKTCSDPEGTACKFLPPVEGCLPYCPKNMILDEVTLKCVYPEDCKYIYLEPVDKCSQYVCVNTGWMLYNLSNNCLKDVQKPDCGFRGMPVQVNNDSCCPEWECPCQCSVLSELSVITFDGNNIALCNMASYILVKLPGEIIVVPPASTSGLCFKKLNVTTHTSELLINRLERKVVVDSVIPSLPFSKEGLSIQDTGAMYVINTPAGISIKWAHITGIIDIQYGLHSNTLMKTEGLCGETMVAINCFHIQHLHLLSVFEIEVFIKSWEIEKSLDVTTRRPVRNCTEDNCTFCMELLNRSVSPQEFCEKMWINSTYFWNYECDALSAYVALCNKHNICVKWRTPDYCPLSCPEGKEYQPCVKPCEAKTCLNKWFYEDSTCSYLREDCVCKSGTVLHRTDSDLCIPEEKCTCTDNRGQPRSAGEIWNGSMRGCCIYSCLENGSIVAVEPECNEDPPPACEREGEVIVLVMELGDCCPKKVCECNMSLCDAIIPTCKSSEKLIVGYSPLSCCPQYQCECDPSVCFNSSQLDCREDQFIVEAKLEDPCCFSYLCVCESCIEPVPLCNEGEILTVDLHTIHYCCPHYYCGESFLLICLVMFYFFYNIFSFSVLEKDDVCIFQEVTVLNPGQSVIQYLDGDLCYTVQCLQEKDYNTGYNAMHFTTVNCSQQCEAHQLYIPSSSHHSCCGTCQNVSCSVLTENGTQIVYEEGSTWIFNCTNYTCAKTVLGAMIVGSGVVCPPFNDTECTKVCTLAEVSNNNSSVSMDTLERAHILREERVCQKMTIRTTIRKNDCISQSPINVASCDGKCPSATIFNVNIDSHLRFCKCCREHGTRNLTVPLHCSGNGTEIMYVIQEPVDCSCQWN